MTASEITRIETRIDSLHESRIAEFKTQKLEIKETLREHRTSQRWFFGLLFTGALAVFGVFAVSHMSLRDKVGIHNDALRVVVGKMNQEHPGYIIEDLDNLFNPQRGASN